MRNLLFALLLLAPISVAEMPSKDYTTADEAGLMQGFPPPESLRVDGSSLLRGPGNRWLYLNMRRLYPTAGVAPAQRPIDLPMRIDGGIERLKIPHPDGTREVDVNTWLRETYTDTVVVVHDGAIVFERYLNGMHADRPHQMMSVTKSFAGLFGLMAVEAELADEDEPVSAYIPELESSGAFGDATFGEVLDMTNSLGFSEDYADPESGIQHYAVVLGLMPPQPGRSYASSIYEYLPTLAKDSSHQHGEVFHYQTPKTDVVNWVTNRVTGISFEDALHEVLWSKLGTDGETYVVLDRNGTLFAGGGMNATPHDLARFAAMMLNQGQFAGQQVVRPETIAKLAKGGNRKAFAKGPNGKGLMGGGDWSYRAQWWVRHTPGKEAFMALGVHGQWIYLDVERNVAVIKQASQPVSVADFYDSFNFNAIDSIIEHLTP